MAYSLQLSHWPLQVSLEILLLKFAAKCHDGSPSDCQTPP